MHLLRWQLGRTRLGHPQRRHQTSAVGISRCYCKSNPHPLLPLVAQLNKEMGVPESSRYPLPCFTSDSQQPHSINSRAILPYFKAIRPLLNNTDISEIIQQLDKLKFHHAPETKISVPTDTFECKRFILTILQQFSMCVERTLKSMNSGAQ